MSALTGKLRNLILVTGANGYIASHVVFQLLSQGYKVRGTVRDPENPKYDFLRTFHPNAEGNLTLVAGELASADCWDSAMKGVTHVVHVASPFNTDPKGNEETVVTPALEGIANVMNAAVANRVKRVVLTSSMCAVCDGHPAETYKSNPVFSEAHWSVANSCQLYEKSKTVAETKAWEIVHKTKTDLVVINPGLVMGPMFNKAQAESSGNCRIMHGLLLKKYTALIPVSLGVVDVRDVAAAHILALQSTMDVAGDRFCCVSSVHTLAEFAQILDAQMKVYGFKVPVHEVPHAMATAVFWTHRDIAVLRRAGMLSRKLAIDNSKIKKKLGIKFRAIEKTCMDHALSLVKSQVVSEHKTPKPVLEGFEVYPPQIPLSPNLVSTKETPPSPSVTPTKLPDVNVPVPPKVVRAPCFGKENEIPSVKPRDGRVGL